MNKRQKEKFEFMIKQLPNEVSREEGHGSFSAALPCMGLTSFSGQKEFIEYIKENSTNTLELKDYYGNLWDYYQNL